ncbi:MAG: ABC transporter permease [Planctomycetota bacterium]
MRLARVWAVARVTALESLRSKILIVAALPAVCILAARSLLSELAMEPAARSLLEASHVAMAIFLLAGALLISGQTLPRDIDNRHLFLVFTKPLAKWEYLLGKIVGLWGVLALMGILVVAVTQSALWSRGGSPRTRERYNIVTPVQEMIPDAGSSIVHWEIPPHKLQELDVVFDLRHWIPGVSYDIEVDAGTGTAQRVKVYSRQVTRLALPQHSFDNIWTLRLVAANNAQKLRLTTKTLWLEGDTHALEESVWAGLGIDIMRILLVSACTLAVSVSFSPGTSMLLGLTLFLVGANRQALVEVPALLTATREVREHDGHAHVDHHERETMLRTVLETCSHGVLALSPDFSRHDVGSHFQRGEHAGWREVAREGWALFKGLAACLLVGALLASRREFLK